MFCANCGKEIRDDAKFCPYCGSTIGGDETAPEAPEVAPAANEMPKTAAVTGAAAAAEAAYADAATDGAALGTKRRGRGLMIAIIAVAAVLCIGVIVVAASLFGSPKAKLGSAVSKSLKAYESAASSVGIPDLAKLYESKKVTQSASIEIRSLADIYTWYYGYMDASPLKGLGVRLTAGYDQSGRKMDLTGAAYYGSTDLITAEASVDNNVVTVYVPEFFDNTAYGLDTSTLGKDLDKLLDSDMPDGYEKLSFNIFDLIDQLSGEHPEADKNATKSLVKAIEVEKVGKGSVEVNGSNIQCTQYHVMIPKDAMKDYVDAMKTAYKDADYDKKIIDALRSTGIPKDDLAYLEDSIKEAYGEGEDVFDQLKDAIKEIGDLELEVYVDGGYVMAVEWNDKISGTKVEFGAYFGGGKNYVDDLSMELRADSTRISFDSSGDHAAKSGTFTDETSIRVRDSWSDESIKSELEYQPKKSSDNFSWHVKLGSSGSFKADGQLTTGKDSLALQLEDLSYTDGGGEKQFALEVGYSIAPYSAQKISTSKTTMLSSMKRSDIEDLVDDIEDNATDWADRMYDKYEDMIDLLGWIF